MTVKSSVEASCRYASTEDSGYHSRGGICHVMMNVDEGHSSFGFPHKILPRFNLTLSQDEFTILCFLSGPYLFKLNLGRWSSNICVTLWTQKSVICLSSIMEHFLTQTACHLNQRRSAFHFGSFEGFQVASHL